jgi:hypothetical protein
MDWWEVPLAHASAFRGQLEASHNGRDVMSDDDLNLGAVSWSDRPAGIGAINKIPGGRGRRRLTTFPVFGQARIRIAWWFLAAGTGLPALIHFAKKIPIRRPRVPGLCPRCGYDLRATPDRCPECGAVPDASARPAAQPLARR